MLEGFAVKAQADGIVVDGEPCVDGLDDIEFAVLETLKDLESDACTLMNLIGLRERGAIPRTERDLRSFRVLGGIEVVPR